MNEADPEKTRPDPPPTHDSIAPTVAKRTASHVAVPGLPREIGGYRIHGVLGAGGMGVVYVAEQLNPKRRVALKVVQGGRFVDTHYLKLFKREIDTLGRLSHPGIASIYEAGCTEDGQHFFTMELVAGQTLRSYVKERLGGDDPTPEQLRERLRLFIDVCEAVQYAHQRGVIHRDLKPQNVLVGEAVSGDASGPAGKPVWVKVLDFGLARITDADVDGTRLTRAGQVQGTLAYMSPEQAQGDDAGIDVRSDVYSLGVILYQLVMDRLPYEMGGSFVDSLRVICDQAPQPMVRSFSGGSGIAEDLRTIVGKALEKEPDRRYASASALGEDVGRYLANRPVRAHPPSAAYRLRKLVARHRLAFSAASAILVLLVALGVTMVVQAGRVRRERDRAEQEAARAAAINAFLKETLGAADPWKRGARGVTLLTALKQAQSKVSTAFLSQPAVQADVLEAIGRTYQGLGQYGDADALLRSVLKLRTTIDPLSDETASALSSVAEVCRSRERNDEAEALSRRALAIRTRLHGETSSQAADSLDDVAGSLIGRGRYGAATPPAEEALEIRARLHGRRSLPVAASLKTLGLLSGARKQARRQEQLAEERLSIVRELQGDASPQVALALRELAAARMAGGNLDSAEKLLLDSLARFRRAFGDDHPEIAVALESLGIVRMRAHRYEEALDSLQKVLAMRRRILGDDSPAVARTVELIASARRQQGGPGEEAEAPKGAAPKGP